MGRESQLPLKRFARRPVGGIGVFAFCVLAASCASGGDVQDAIVGTWIPVEAPRSDLGPEFDFADATITFNSDGTWTGSDGCNALNGDFTFDGSDFASPEESFPLVGCVSGSLSYNELLPAAHRAEVEAEHMTLFDGNDRELVRLEKLGTGDS